MAPSLQNIIQLHQAAADPMFAMANNVMGFFKKMSLVAELTPMQVGMMARGVKGTIYSPDRGIQVRFSITNVKGSERIQVDDTNLDGPLEIAEMAAFWGMLARAIKDPGLRASLIIPKD